MTSKSYEKEIFHFVIMTQNASKISTILNAKKMTDENLQKNTSVAKKTFFFEI